MAIELPREVWLIVARFLPFWSRASLRVGVASARPERRATQWLMAEARLTQRAGFRRLRFAGRPRTVAMTSARPRRRDPNDGILLF